MPLGYNPCRMMIPYGYRNCFFRWILHRSSRYPLFLATAILGFSLLPSRFIHAAASLEYTVAETNLDAASLLQNATGHWNSVAKVRWGPDPYPTEFRSLWNPSGLFFCLDASDNQPWHTMKNRDDHLWEEEAVEIFLDPDGSGSNYLLLGISPANVVCDVVVRRTWPTKQSDIRWNLKGMKSVVSPIQDPAGKNTGWRAILYLPWSGFRTLPSTKGVSLPPKAGDQWRFNLFRIKRPGGRTDPEKDVLYAAWSPTQEPSIHVPRAFRPLVFAH